MVGEEVEESKSDGGRVRRSGEGGEGERNGVDRESIEAVRRREEELRFEKGRSPAQRKLPLLEAAVPEGDKKVVKEKEKEKEQTGHDLRKRAKKDNEDLLPPPPADWGLSETIAESTETLRRHKVVVVLGYSITVYSGRGLSDEDFSKLETTWATEGIAYSLRRGLIEGIEKKTYYLRGVQDIGGDWWRLIHEGSDAEEERIEIIWRNGGDDV
ncbi:hypothetical protein BT69DRAFT_564140 [Atractiella rhizophila]|nr:hypothetical protein BT69DRAFT_564140 [Atractiella rhizophila]